MTEPKPRSGSRGPGLATLAGGSVALMAVVFVLLAHRLAAGHDPVLSADRHVAARPLVVRRIVERTVIETTIHSRAHAAAMHQAESSSPIVTSESGGETAAPVTRSS